MTLGMSFCVQLPLLIISKIISVSYINSTNTKNYSVVSSVMHFDAYISESMNNKKFMLTITKITFH